MKNIPTLRYEAEIERAKNGSLKIWLSVPQSNYLQTIDKVAINPQPHFSYADDKNNSILGWQTNDPNFKVAIDFDYANIFKKPEINPEICGIPIDESFQLYLKSEPFLEQTEAIKQLAQKIAGNESPYQAAEKIFTWVAQNFKYEYPPSQRGAENLDLQNLCGDCGEYSSLFVALCRAVGIPAKIDIGFFITPSSEINEHAWASIYLEPYGWLPVDCQFATLEKTFEKGRELYFLNTPENRIIFTSGFTIPLKPKLLPDDDLAYWQNQSLPIGLDWVQTLQPLIFITTKNNPAEFSQKFELKNN